MIVTCIVFIALATLLFADHSWGNVLSNRRNALVFEGRNQDYGAYRMRRENPRNVMWALFLTTGIAVTALLALKKISGVEKVFKEELLSVTTDQIFIELPKVKEEKPKESAAQENEVEQPPRTQGQTENLPPEVVEEGPTDEHEALVDPVEIGDPDGTENGINGPRENGGGGGSETGEGEKKKDYDFVTEMPAFPGGDLGKLHYVSKNARYPTLAREMGREGTVLISFVIDETGKVTDVKVLRGLIGGKDLEQEALRVIEKMPPWSPGKMNGVPVRVRQIIPVKFTLRNE
jgi:periplasmic protein TonB